MKGTFKALCLTVAAAMSLGFFTACGPDEGGPAGEKGKNTDNSFSMVTTWTASGLVNHYNSNTNCEAFNYFVVEGMWWNLRSTDAILCQVAEELPTHRREPIAKYEDVIGKDAYDYYLAQNCDEVAVTTGKIRDGAKWQNGEPVVAKDIWAYYYLMHPTSSNYLAAVKAVDDRTVEYVWNPLKEPNDTVKGQLLASDKSATVKYDLFAQFVDPFFDIVMHSPVNTDQNLWGAFNRFSTPEQIIEMNKIRNSFYAFSPSWYVATGPFKLDAFSATQILLTKNEYYWAADQIGFDRVKLYSSSDLNQTYQLITNGYVDYYDGFIQQDTLESMLAANPDLINIKMYDQGAYGLIFNMKRPYFTDKVREAFQYIFDRDEIKNASNPYATTSWYPLMGMAPSDASFTMSEKHFAELPKYSKDHAKAEQLLREAGWEKSGGKWMADGKAVSLVMGCPVGDNRASVAAEAAATQLEAFGIEVDLMKSSAFFANATSDNSPYDLCVEWTDLCMAFSYPANYYTQFNAVYAKYAQLERYPANDSDPQRAGNLKLTVKGLDGDEKEYAFADYLNAFFSLNEEEFTYIVDVFNLGLARLNIGLQFFQNVTASTYNVGKVKGIPFEELWRENRNVSYVPAIGTDDFYLAAKTNLVFAENYMFVNGIYQPNA